MSTQTTVPSHLIVHPRDGHYEYLWLTKAGADDVRHLAQLRNLILEHFTGALNATLLLVHGTYRLVVITASNGESVTPLPATLSAPAQLLIDAFEDIAEITRQLSPGRADPTRETLTLPLNDSVQLPEHLSSVNELALERALAHIGSAGQSGAR